MKKPNLFLACAAVVAASMEQVFRPGFQPLWEQQQQAKSGVVTAASSYGTPAEAVAVADPLRTTAGSLVVEALRAQDNPQVVAIEVNGNPVDAVPIRRVHTGEGAMADLATAADAIAGTTLVGNLTFDNGSKNNDSVSNAIADGTGHSAAINAKLATRKPTFSLAALLNALEDVALEEEIRFVVLFDQNDNGELGRVKVFEVDTNAHAVGAINAAVAAFSVAVADFEVDTTPASAAERLAGE